MTDNEGFAPQCAVVDFHHARGPEVEFWVTPEGQVLYDGNDWSLLPFMALSDGVHTMLEDYSYFTLLNKAPSTTTSAQSAKSEENMEYQAQTGDTSLFGIACTRQIRSDRLKRRSADVTRSSVQKAVVLIVKDVKGLGELRTRLGMVTEAWFAQEDFSDIKILNAFQESLVHRSTITPEEADYFSGLSLREVIYEFRFQTLTLVKCLLLQRKVLFFGSKCERLCLLQFALLSLLPGLLSHLDDCAHPSLSSPAPPSDTDPQLPRTTSRADLLKYMGLPLKIFGTGAFFGPYTPLQHLDILASYSTKSYVVCSTNSLLLQSQSRYADVLVNLDESPISISILSPSLRQALQLSAADRRWVDYLTQEVLDTWDPEHPSRPKGMGFAGSEEAIRLHFEEYILSLCSCATYQIYRQKMDEQKKRRSDDRSRSRSARRDESEESIADQEREVRSTQAEQSTNGGLAPPTGTLNVNTVVDLIDANPAENTVDFGEAYLAAWHETRNYQRFIESVGDKRVFEMIEPRHPTAGGFNIEDVQRRLQQNIADLHLDEKYRQGWEHAGKMYEAGRERWKESMGKFWGEMERRRDQSRSQTRQEASHESQKEKSTVASSEAEGVGFVFANDGTAAVADSSNPASGGWSNAFKDRVARGQKPDTAAIQAAARENAARAGAYLSSWGTWARERSSQWSEQRTKKASEAETSASTGP